MLARPVAEGDLIAFCRSRSSLPMPARARVLAVSAIPRNPAGKVDRKALIDRLRSEHPG